MERYATFTKSFDEVLRDNPMLTKDNELIVVLNGQQYVIKINERNCKYYKVLTPRVI